MSSHKKILTKKQLANLREYLWDYFHLPHEHYGFENAKTTDDVVKLSMEYCERKKFISKVDKTNLFFRDQFLLKCVSPLMSQLKKKYNRVKTDDGCFKSIKNKWYLRGFECEQNGNNYYYYFPRPNDELNRIRIQDEGRVEAKKISFEIREIERVEYLKQLPAPEKIDKITDGNEIA